jgi:hypothetical protein
MKMIMMDKIILEFVRKWKKELEKLSVRLENPKFGEFVGKGLNEGITLASFISTEEEFKSLLKEGILLSKDILNDVEKNRWSHPEILDAVIGFQYVVRRFPGKNFKNFFLKTAQEPTAARAMDFLGRATAFFTSFAEKVEGFRTFIEEEKNLYDSLLEELMPEEIAIKREKVSKFISGLLASGDIKGPPEDLENEWFAKLTSQNLDQRSNLIVQLRHYLLTLKRPGEKAWSEEEIRDFCAEFGFNVIVRKSSVDLMPQ